MRRLLALAFLLAAGPALAADNYNATEGAGKVFRCVDNAGVCSPAFLFLSGAVASGAFSSGAIASGAVASGAYASGAFASGSIASGAMVDLGAVADAAATAGSTGTLSAKLRLMTTQLATINTTLGSPFQAGGSIGNTTFASTQSGTWTVQPGNTANTTPWLVTGSGTAGSAATGVLSVQGIASMTPLLANPGTAANWGVGTSTQNSASIANGQLVLGQFNTTPTTITTGNMSPMQMDNAGKLLVNCTGCSSSSSITSWGGGTLGAMANYGTSPGAVLVPGINAFVTNSNANGQAVAANSSPVVLPTAQVTADPCSLGNKTNLPISQNGTSSVQLVGLSGSTVIYVCSLSLIAAGATTVVLTTGTGTACVTGNAAVIGDTTANIANGLSLAANGGLTLGNGAGTIAKGAASSELCMTLGTNVRMSGNLTYVQQ